MTRIKAAFLVLGLIASLSAGCAFDRHVDVTATKDLNRGFRTFKKATPHPPADFQVSDSAWFSDAGDRIRLRKNLRVRLHFRPRHLPSVFKKKILLVSEKPIGIADIASQITTSTGLLVTVTKPRTMGISGAAQGIGTPGMMGPSLSGAPSGSSPAPPPPTRHEGADSFLNKKIRVDWDGNLEGLLDYAASRFGLFWTYRDHVISFGRSMTRVFRISAAPVMNVVSNSISDAGMTGLSSVLMNEGAAGMMGGGMGMMGGYGGYGGGMGTMG
ncbi:hypothetical protein BOX30_05145, partial [Leptospirillum ferriphilum]